jgi:hypothetical protein
MGVFALLLAGSGHSFTLAAVNLTLIGFAGGLFAVPLNALLQHRAGRGGKGAAARDQQFSQHGRHCRGVGCAVAADRPSGGVRSASSSSSAS